MIVTKIRPPKKKPYAKGDRARKPAESAAKRVVDTSRMTQVGGWETTPFVSLSREPWESEIAE